MTSDLLWFAPRLSDGVDAHDRDAVAGDDAVSEITIYVQLHVTREFPLWNGIRTLLQLKHLSWNGGRIYHESDRVEEGGREGGRREGGGSE